MKRITRKDAIDRIERFNDYTDGLKLKMFEDGGYKRLAVMRLNGSVMITYTFETYYQVVHAIAFVGDYINMSKGEGLRL